MIKRLFTASLLCVGAAVWAQTPPPEVIGKVAEVQGVVTISDGVTVGTAVPGTVITEGNRFVTASSGAARLTMDNGCVINLKPNESLVINGKLACRELIASIRPVGSNLAAAGVGGGAPTGGGLSWGTGLVLGGGALLAAGLSGGSSSPDTTGGNGTGGNGTGGNGTGGSGTGGSGTGGSGTGGGGAGGGIPVVPISGQ